MIEALVNGRVLTDDGVRDDITVLLKEDRIFQVSSAKERQEDIDQQRDLQGALLLPGFIDIQVNGGNGLLFNEAPTVETIVEIGKAHRKFGTTGFFPTLISDDLAVISKAIAAVTDAIKQGVSGLLGIHIEGPFLNPEKKGIHDAGYFRSMDDDAVSLLSKPSGGKTLVTLAPEMASPALIRRLAENGVIVLAGHSNASYTETRAALAAGLTGFTHLFNAMPPLASRAPGIVGAALEDQKSWCSIIVDGHHVHPATLGLGISCKGKDRFLLITDAMPTVGTDLEMFTLQGQPISVADGKCLAADGALAGAHLDMAGAVRNTVSLLSIDLGQAVNMASRYPAEFLGLGGELGRIKEGFRADLVLADDNLNILDTWIGGECANHVQGSI